MPSKTRVTLLAQLRDGTGPVAWEEFFQRYWPVIYGFAVRRGCSPNTAEDVVQDVMLKVFEKREIFRYDPERGRFRDWLGTIVRHRVADLRRRPSERVRPGAQNDAAEYAGESAQPGPEALWETVFEQAVLMAVLDVVRRETEPRDFVAFELTMLASVPPAEAAAALGTTRYAVYKARRRVLRRLEDLTRGYSDDGRLPERVREALLLRPAPADERTLSLRVGETMRRALESSS